MTTNQVFVYGTLKRNNRVRGLDQFGDAVFVGLAETTDSQYDLWCLGAFPAISLNGNNTIKGEVWRVNDAVMDQLDMIEGYPAFYRRRIIETTQGPAWVYYLQPQDIKDFGMCKQIHGERALEWTGD